MKTLRIAMMTTLVLGAATGLAKAQLGGPPPIQTIPSGTGSSRGMGLPGIDGHGPPGMDPLPRMEEQQARSRNSERQKRLVADTDRLLALIADLKHQIEQADKDGQPADVTKKAEEIEKLAKSVKERMKG
ncbi:MAG TPA: hypothetical protein VK578_18300 [Edaphobacter sp.]|nr:hypothetical protein [Edaphobacter sp.]